MLRLGEVRKRLPGEGGAADSGIPLLPGISAPTILLALAAFLLSAAPASAQGHLLGARMALGIPSGGFAVPVTVEYRLRVGPDARELPFSLLTPGQTRLATFRAVVLGRRVPLELEETRERYWEGTLELPSRSAADSLSGAPDSGEWEFTLRLSYLVEGSRGEDGRVTIPIPAPGWPPADPHPETFVAGVEVPRGLTVTESFPTSVTARPRGDQGGTYRISLQGVPSMLVFRVVQGEASVFRLERVLDGLVVALLLIMGILGVRYLRGGGE